MTVQLPDASLKERESGTFLRHLSGPAYAEDLNCWQTPCEEACPQACEESSDASPCRWHHSAHNVGVISDDGHVFTKAAGPTRNSGKARGKATELSTLCMVFDESIRCGGVHHYNYQILGGELRVADGAGFVFDSKVRRNNIQQMRSVFVNQRGHICMRNNKSVVKLQERVPPLHVGAFLTLNVDLDNLTVTFSICDEWGTVIGSVNVSLHVMLDGSFAPNKLRSGFFCAVVTGDISVSLF